MAGERIHGDRAALYDLIYSWLDYDAESAAVHDRLKAEGLPDGARVVEGACGTGNHLVRLQRWYDVLGFDLADGMLDEARKKLPGVRLWKDDLRTFALDAPVDAFLCLFSSIGYVGPLEAFRECARRVAAAVKPRGLALVQPWFTPTSIQPGHAGLSKYEREDLKLARANVVVVEGRRTILDFHWLVARRGAPAVETFTDRHVLWLYTPEEMTAAFQDAGFETRWEEAHHERLLGQRGLILARRTGR